MARARNIKPGFFRNADLIELPPLTRILFAGLWTLADRAGKLFDRPKQIKMDVLPGDDYDVDSALNDLQKAGFIVRYVIEGKRYLRIENFGKHQNPHCKEPESEIPDPIENCASTVQAPCENCARTEVAGLIPDSGFLIPDIPTAQQSEPPAKKPRALIFDAVTYLTSHGVGEKVARDWTAMRKAKKATPSETAIAGIEREASKAGLPLEAALSVCCERGWTGFKAEWVAGQQIAGAPRPRQLAI